MRMKKKFLLSLAIVLVAAVVWDVINTELHEEVFFTFEDHCKAKGYEVITYEVTTDDGYILTLYRIPGKGKPVFLLHGLVVTSECYVINQCTKAPAFQLSDSGFDVWLGNMRGNHISTGHTTYDNESKEYWEYSFEDLVDHDLKTFVMFVKAYTGYQKIVVVGHSLGGIIITHAMSLYPHYSQHISLAVLLGTPGSKVTPKSWYIRFLATGIVQTFSRLFGVKSFLYWFESPFMAKIFAYFKPVVRVIAKDMMDLDLIGGKPEDIVIYSYKNRGGISIKAIQYFVQLYWNKQEELRRFDFGEEENFKRYGSLKPPVIYYSNISVNTAIINGRFDTVFTPDDSKVLMNGIKKEFLVFYNDTYDLDHAAYLFSCNNSHIEDLIRLIHQFG